MTFADAHVFGLTLVEVAVIVAAVGYVTSLVKDWRPMRTLRAENIDLRATLEGLQKRLDGAETKIAEQKDEIDRLKKATDLSALQTENATILSTLEKIATGMTVHDEVLRTNTQVLRLLTDKLNGKELLDKAAP